MSEWVFIGTWHGKHHVAKQTGLDRYGVGMGWVGGGLHKQGTCSRLSCLNNAPSLIIMSVQHEINGLASRFAQSPIPFIIWTSSHQTPIACCRHCTPEYPEWATPPPTPTSTTVGSGRHPVTSIVSDRRYLSFLRVTLHLPTYSQSFEGDPNYF